MSRKLSLLVLALLLMGLTGGRSGTASAASNNQAGSPQTWTVLVGGQGEIEQTEHGPAGAWQFMKFYPNRITVNAGDTIVWKLNAAEIHNVIFPPPGQNYVPFVTPQGGPPPELVVNPLGVVSTGGPTYDGSAAASSGSISMAPPGVQEYRLTFTKAGSFNYLCSIHSTQLPNGQVEGMLGNVTVQTAGTAYPRTQAQIDAEAQAAIAADAQTALGAEAQAKQVAPPEAGPNGAMIYHGNMGYDFGDFGYMRFSPTDFTIHVGDTIEWMQTSAVTPHTLTLLSGGKEPDLVMVTPQAAGPPKFTINPQILAPAGGASYNGTGFYSSGFINGTQDPAPGPRTYHLTFTKAGTYEYVCMLHDTLGMTGHVTVLGAGSMPGMPRTGYGDVLPVVAGWSALMLLLAGLTLRRRAARRAQG